MTDWDRDKFEKWLEGQPPEMVSSFAFRLLMRLMSSYLRGNKFHFGGSFGEQLYFASSRDYYLQITSSKQMDSRNYGRRAGLFTLFHALRWALFVKLEKVPEAKNPKNIAHLTSFLAGDKMKFEFDPEHISRAIWPSVAADIEFVETGQSAKALLNKALFLDKDGGWSAQDWELIKSLRDEAGYEFWYRFLVTFYTGDGVTNFYDFNFAPRLENPVTNWDMLREIGLILEAEWEKGAIHIAKLIEDIEEKYTGETPKIGDNSASYGQILEELISPRLVRENLKREGLAPKALNQKLMERLQEIEADLRLHRPDDHHAINQIVEIKAISISLDQYLPEALLTEDTPIAPTVDRVRELGRKFIELSDSSDTVHISVVAAIGIVVSVLGGPAVAAALVGGTFIKRADININFGKQNITVKKKKVKGKK